MPEEKKFNDEMMKGMVEFLKNTTEEEKKELFENYVKPFTTQDYQKRSSTYVPTDNEITIAINER